MDTHIKLYKHQQPFLSVYSPFFILLFTLLCISCQPNQQDAILIGFSQCVDDDDWRQAMYFEMQKELAFYPEARLIYKNADASNAQQIEDIKSLRDEGVDILIVSPNEAQPITPIVEEVYASGIPVIVVDRKIASDKYTAYVGGDNYEIGNIAGAYAASLLPEGGKILEISGLPGSTPAQERHRGFTDALSRFNNLSLLDSINGQWEEHIARQEIRRQLSRVKEADLIFAFNDMMARATHEVLDSAKVHSKPILFGIDGLFGPSLGIDMVSQGILDATFLYPTGGDKAIELAVNILKGKPFDKENILQTTVIDQSNVKIIKSQAEKIYDQQQDIVNQQRAIEEQLAVYQNQRTLLYVLISSLAAAIILGAFALYALREKLETNRELKSKNEEILKQQQQIMQLAQESEEANQAKFRFFTDISHEFRTPITLILTSIEDILESGSSHKQALQRDILLIKRNAARLLRLVSQLLDFRRIEHGKMEVKASPGDLIPFIREIFSAFEATAAKRKIDYQLLCLESELPMWFDDSMLDKVFFNLLSNAFKFTPNSGKITLMVEKDKSTQKARVLIKDNGQGMSKNQMAHAFERFYQGEQNSSMGTGLGLSLSHELIHLHHGSIKVDSEPAKGTSFEVKLPLGDTHFKESERCHSSRNEHSTVLKTIYEDEDAFEQEESVSVGSPSGFSILVIEDNTDLRKFLLTKLQQHYQVWGAEDGDSGLVLAQKEVPDLIISDIMMPGTSGLQLARQLKSDLRTSHIPIILLTARDTTEQQVEGLQTGADAYIVKPFHTRYLLARVQQLLQSRKALQAHYKSGATESAPFPPPVDGISTIDQEFLDAFRSEVLQKLGDSELHVNDIAKAIGLSRVQLYRKVKALLEVSVNDYIRQLRLEKARALLCQQELSIAEVAYAVGFSSPAYFSTVFKNEYQQSPSEFVRDTTSAS